MKTQFIKFFLLLMSVHFIATAEKFSFNSPTALSTRQRINKRVNKCFSYYFDSPSTTQDLTTQYLTSQKVMSPLKFSYNKLIRNDILSTKKYNADAFVNALEQKMLALDRSHTGVDELNWNITHINGYELKNIKFLFAKSFLHWSHTIEKNHIHFPPSETFDGPWSSVYMDLVNKTEKDDAHPTKESRLKTFQRKMISMLESQGSKVVYFLPTLFTGPRLDGGFDVADIYSVAKDNGSLAEFREVVSELSRKEIAVVVDTPANHLSDQSPLFQALLAGDLSKQEYFITSDKEPKIRSRNYGSDQDSIDYELEDGSGRTYNRELVFSNVEKDHWHPYDIPIADPVTHKKIPGQFKRIWVYSTFYSHQIDLNIQSPKVLSMWFNFIGFWSAMGVSGFRGDAAQWWVKLPGQSGRNQSETFAVHSLFYQLIKLLNKDGFYLPETVADVETTASFAGGLRGYQDSLHSKSSGVYMLQLAEAIRAYAITGDFSMAYELLNFIINKYPDDVKILFPLLSHDEIYLGFLKNRGHLHSQVSEFIKQHGGVVFKKENSAAGGLSQILGDDIFSFFYKLAYSLNASPYSQFGTEMGFGNNWKKLYKSAYERLSREISLGRRSPDDPIFKTIKELRLQNSQSAPPDNTSPETLRELYADARDLHRAEVSSDADEFQQAENGKNKYFNFVKHIAQTRSQFPALHSGKMQVLETYDNQTTGLLRKSKDGEDSILVVANGSEKTKTIRVHIPANEIDNIPGLLEKMSRQGLLEVDRNQIITLTGPFEKYENDQGYILSFSLSAKDVLWLKLR